MEVASDVNQSKRFARFSFYEKYVIECSLVIASHWIEQRSERKLGHDMAWITANELFAELTNKSAFMFPDTTTHELIDDTCDTLHASAKKVVL